MRPFLFLLLLGFYGQCYAQGFSAGARSGVGHLLAINHDGALLKPTNKVIWEKGLYTRYEAKRFAYELQMLNYNFYVPQLPFTSYPGCGTTSTRSISETSFSRTNEYNLVAQYRISNRQSKLKSYIGLGLALAYYNNSWENRWQYENATEIHTTRGTEKNLQSFLGFSNYTSYPLGKNLNIHSSVCLNIDPADVASPTPWSFVTNSFSKFSINIGCGYIF